MVGPQWLWERLGSWARRAAAAALACRPVPRHVAFIMDGNRRFAEARQLRKVEGHAFGYQRLIDALEWCLDLGVTCVSVYAFSIDNYRRSGEEVATLMQLAEEKLAHMLQEHDVLERHGVQVRVIGDLSLAPPAVQAAAARVMEATKHHNRAVLNLCFSYTASEELMQALDGLAAQQAPSRCNSTLSGSSSLAPQQAAAGGPVIGSSTDPSSSSSSGSVVAAFEGQLYTRGCPPVDLLVRTSGETRLSDFLLWQCRHALLVFTQVLWPDFGFLDLVSAVLQYQRHAGHLQRLRQVADTQAEAAAAAAAAAPGAEAVAGAAALAAAAVELAEMQGPWQQLQPVKVAATERQHGQSCSPCSIASPASPSSPSSRSDASEEAAVAAAATTVHEIPPAVVAAPLRQRRAVGSTLQQGTA